MKKGIYLAIVTAVISGISVFVASFASKAVKDPYILTTGRNIIVAVWFSSVLLGIWLSSRSASRRSGDLKPIDCFVGIPPRNDERCNLLAMTPKKWGQLVLIGIIGGSIPFLLFFKGLSLSTAAGGQLINKTMFIWVGLLAFMFLKEKFNKWQLFALAILVTGNYFLATPKSWIFGRGELLVLVATLFWAAEAIVAKIVLKNMPSIILTWGRMFFGSLIMLGYLAITHKIGSFQLLNTDQLLWIILPSMLLFVYVWFWFSSLKYAPVTLVTSILVIASPITTLLSSTFITHKFQPLQLIGSVLIIFGAIIFIRCFKNLAIENSMKIENLPTGRQVGN
jgi:drug/metabolite transporter (DMT)-like permease